MSAISSSPQQLFLCSSQYKRWLLQPDTLAKKKKDVVDRMRSSGETKTLNIEDESRLRRFYEEILLGVCGQLSTIPVSVKYTAITYFKRFMLYHSMMENDPFLLIITCLFIACKVEESYHDVSTLCNLVEFQLDEVVIKESPERVLAFEPLVLESLNYDLIVHHPYQALEGLTLLLEADMPNLFKGTATAKGMEGVRIQAFKITQISLLTDAVFLFTPSQIALAALSIAAKSEESEAAVSASVLEWIQSKINSRPDLQSKLMESVSSAESMLIEAQKPIDQEALKLTMRKYKFLKSKKNKPE